MDKNKEKKPDSSPNKPFDQGKAFQEVSEEMATNPKLKEMRPTPQPKDFDEIEY
ncbi:hypothetical protein [Bacillus sp. FSL K6-3431]|uniref:hypothetical protein n=1 Tax=Bacillus sp. FSL K6-3431 TaxID=2921500 RepID=UPI0030FB0628